jgi:hypothetical protein
VRLTLKRFTRKTHPRASGQAARRLPRLTVQPAGVACKRRDAVRLALNEPARPAGAAFGVLSGATVSWAAQRQTFRLARNPIRYFLPAGARATWLSYVWQNLGAGAETTASCPVGRNPPRILRRLDTLHVQTTTRSRYTPRSCQAPAMNDPSAQIRAQGGAWRTSVSCAQTWPKRLRQRCASVAVARQRHRKNHLAPCL